MKPTKPGVLAVVAVVIAGVTWLVLGLVYRQLPPFPWTSVPTLLILAIAEAYSGLTLRARLSGRTMAKPIEPIGVARMAAFAKASSYVAALIAGIAAGFSLYLLGSLNKSVPRHDALAAVGTLAAAIVFGAAALFLEHCCRTRRNPDDEDDRHRTHLRLCWLLDRPVPEEDWNVMDSPATRPAEAGLGAPDERPARLKVGVVGVGRAGAALGAALARAGHDVVAASGVSEASAERARRFLPGALLTEPAEVLARSDLALLTVPDDALPGLVAGLAETGAPLSGRMVAHASGRHGTAVLEPATRRGALPMAMHPVMTFTGRPDDVDRMAGACFGVTAPEPLRPAAMALVIEMGGDPVFIAESDRGLYHAALAGAANHLVTLVAESGALLSEAGVPDPARMLGPLLSAALDNALRFGFSALTGPVARGDAGTVADHIEALRRASPEALAAYLALARLTADRALSAGTLRPDDASRLLDVLGGPQ